MQGIQRVVARWVLNDEVQGGYLAASILLYYHYWVLGRLGKCSPDDPMMIRRSSHESELKGEASQPSL